MKKLIIPALAAASLTLAACSSSPSIEEVTKSCQDHVSGYVKYPGTASWVEPRIQEEQNGKIHIAGSADFDNDAGNPVRTNYQCVLDIEQGDWERKPILEPQNPTQSKWDENSWGGYRSPMLEKYGDSMSLKSW